MKKLILFSVLLAVTAAILLAVSAVTADTSSAQEPQSAGDVYLMRAQDDRLVVYLGDELILRTDTQVSALPKADRLKLSRGIVVYSEKELRKLLEDYCS